MVKPPNPGLWCECCNYEFFLTALFAICNRNFILRHEDLRVHVYIIAKSIREATYLKINNGVTCPVVREVHDRTEKPPCNEPKCCLNPLSLFQYLANIGDNSLR